MKKQPKIFFLYRLFCVLMALHIINLHVVSVSVDSPNSDTHRTLYGGFTGNSSVHELESISEWALEKCLHIPDSTPEPDDSDEESDLIDVGKDFFFGQPFSFRLEPVARYVASVPVMPNLLWVPGFPQEITPPPPKTFV